MAVPPEVQIETGANDQTPVPAANGGALAAADGGLGAACAGGAGGALTAGGGAFHPWLDALHAGVDLLTACVVGVVCEDVVQSFVVLTLLVVAAVEMDDFSVL